MNWNYAAQAHVDKNNVGPPYIVALGDYDGDLWISNPDGDVSHTITQDESRHLAGLCRPGQVVFGSLVDIRAQLHLFDGTVLHVATPFDGERFSVVWYASRNHHYIKDYDYEFLEHLGFHLPGAHDDHGGGEQPARLLQGHSAAANRPDNSATATATAASAQHERRTRKQQSNGAAHVDVEKARRMDL